MEDKTTADVQARLDKAEQLPWIKAIRNFKPDSGDSALDAAFEIYRTKAMHRILDGYIYGKSVMERIEDGTLMTPNYSATDITIDEFHTPKGEEHGR